MSSRTLQRANDAGVLARLFENGRGSMSPTLARYVLTLGFGKEDQTRMGELAESNQSGQLSEEERSELVEFVRAGHILALFHSRARKALKARAKV